MTVSWFRTSHRLVQEQVDQLTAHLLTTHEDRDLDEKELLLLLTCGVEDAAASLSAPISVCLDQLDEEACVRRVRLLVCPRLLPAPVFSLSVLFDKKVSRGLLRKAGTRVKVIRVEVSQNVVHARTSGWMTSTRPGKLRDFGHRGLQPRALGSIKAGLLPLHAGITSTRLHRRRGQGARSPTPGQLRPGQRAHVGKLQHPSPSPAAREAGSLSFSL